MAGATGGAESWTLDAPKPEPISPRGIVGTRSLALLQAGSAVLGAILVLFVDLDNRLGLSALLLATAVCLLASQFLLGRYGDLLRAAMVAPLAIGALLVDSRVFVVVALILAMNLQWILKRRRHRWFVPTVLVADIAVCVVAAIVDAPQWLLINLTLAVMMPTHILITRRVRNRAEQKDHDLNEVLRTACISVYETDLESRRYSMLTGPLLEQTGWTYSEWEQKGDSLVHPDDRDQFWIDPQDFSEDTLLDRTARFRRPDGEYMWLRDVSRLVVDVDGRRRIMGLLVDVSESQTELMRMRRRAHIDALTGVSNRFALLDVLEERLSANRDGDARFALLVIDVNRFKEINDTLGHSFGDETLQAIAERLDAIMRPGDEIGRIGGDEFAVVARDVVSHEQAAAVAERITAASAEPIQLGSVRLNMSISIGVALSEPGVTGKELLKRADGAMYAAKRSARPYQVFAPPIDDDSGADVALSAQVPAAVSNGQFELHFQPKVDYLTGSVCGVEGLARWRHPDLGLLPPDDFMHLVAVSDAFGFFTDRMLDAGIEFAASAREHDLQLTVSINVSIVSLYDEGFPLRVRRMLERHGVEPSSVILEITEQDIMEETAGAPPVLEKLHQLGVGVSIDDFGTGYSSLARLQDLPVSEIKIDRRFVTNAYANKSDRVIVRSIIDLASNLNLRVVAEGVESDEDAALLLDLGCDQGQGYLYGKALPAHEVLLAVSGPEVRLHLVEGLVDSDTEEAS